MIRADGNMYPLDIRVSLNRALSDPSRHFWVRYHALMGPVEESGKDMRPMYADNGSYPNEVIYKRYVGPHWEDGLTLYTTHILAIMVEDDYCPYCEAELVNLDNVGISDLPMCDSCAEVTDLERAGEGLIADGGLI